MHANGIDITGKSFGRLTAISRAPNSVGGKTRWLFRCACGREKVIISANVRNGFTQSCGCLQRELTGKRSKQIHTTHGASRTPDWNRWTSMIRRCHSPTDKAFKNYGARGITVCDRWRGPGGFANYMADMGPRPSSMHSLERIDNDGPYSPENCRWAIAAEQLRNRRNSRWVEHAGRRLTISDWARELGLNESTLYHRWRRGERGEQLLRPAGPSGRRNHPANSSK